MITITAHGRLAHQPELILIRGGSSVCEFRLLSSRYAKGAEQTEAVTFFCYGEDAEEFCSTTVKGQEISATGTQETQYHVKDGVQKTYVKYRLTWFSRGRKPYVGERGSSVQDASQDRIGNRDGGNAQRPQSGYAPHQNERQRPPQREPASQQRGDYSHSGFHGMPDDGDDPKFI